MKNTMTDRDVKMLAKVVVDAQSDRVLGFHMVGDHASEILQVIPPPLTPQLILKNMVKDHASEILQVVPHN